MFDDDEVDLHKQVIPLIVGRTALIVLDMQRGFLSEGSVLEVPQGRAMIPVLNGVIRACRASGVPVVFTQFVYDPRVPTLFGELHPEHKPKEPFQPAGPGYPSSCCLLGDKSTELHPDVDRRPDDFVVPKSGYDAFFRTSLDDRLRLSGIDTVMLAGVLTDVCVWHTLSGAIHRGYKAVVLRDAVATLSDSVQQAVLRSIGWSAGRVISSGKAVAELEATSGR